MNEINLALHQHNTSRNHSTTATQGAASRSSDNGAETSGRRPRETAGAGGGGSGWRRQAREAAGAGGGFGRLSCCVVRGFAAFRLRTASKSHQNLLNI